MKKAGDQPAFFISGYAGSDPGGSGQGFVVQQEDDALHVPVDVPEPGGETAEPGERDADDSDNQQEADEEGQQRVPEGADHPVVVAVDQVAMGALGGVVDDEGDDAEQTRAGTQEVQHISDDHHG